MEAGRIGGGETRAAGRGKVGRSGAPVGRDHQYGGTTKKQSKNGSAQKLVEGRILGRFPEDDEFGLGGRHPLRLQQEVTEILIAPATP
jgi:hypothetical protein